MTTKFCGNFRSVTNWKIMIYGLSAQNRTIQVSQTAIKMGMFCDAGHRLYGEMALEQIVLIGLGEVDSHYHPRIMNRSHP